MVGAETFRGLVIDSNDTIVFRQSYMLGNIASQNYLRNFVAFEKLGYQALNVFPVFVTNHGD
jgi:hypothetical protein